MQIIVPKRVVPITVDYPIFFLAGPILGAPQWHEEMVSWLTGVGKQKPTIVCPCRWDKSHPLSGSFVQGGVEKESQTSWERHYLALAGSHPNLRGCIIFWLAEESKANPRSDGSPYARDTYGELGEWRWRMKTEKARVVVGAEPGFPGLRQIKQNFSEALGYPFTVHSNMFQTVQAALNMACR